MIILDHNIPDDQTVLLRRWRIHFRQVGHEIGRQEWDDQQEILPYLHGAKHATFFTRDLGFFHIRLCHSSYCIVVVTGLYSETAFLMRQFLRHPAFKTRMQRMGKVIKLSSKGIVWWEIGGSRQQNILWYR